MTKPANLAWMTTTAASLLVAIALVACSEDEKRPPVLTESNGVNSPCERVGGICATSATACGERRASAGNSLGCEGEGAICCVLSDGGRPLDGAPDAAPDVTSSDAAADAPIDAPADVALDVSDAASD